MVKWDDKRHEMDAFFDSLVFCSIAQCPAGLLEFNRECYDDLLSELYKLNATGSFANQLNNAVMLFDNILEKSLFNPNSWSIFVALDSAFVGEFEAMSFDDNKWKVIGR